MEAIAHESRICCMTVECERNAIKYCTICAQLFCEEHDKVHEPLLKVLLKPHTVLTVEEYIAEREDNSKYCTQHQKSLLFVACVNCYKPMCAECLDETTPQYIDCHNDGEEKHVTRSIGQVSVRVQDEIQQLLSELRMRELKCADTLQEMQKSYDRKMEENREDLDKLAAKVKELHKTIDEFATETRDSLIAHMTENKEVMQKLEANFSEYQKSCRQIHERTTRFLNSEAIVKNRRRIKDDIEALVSFEFDKRLKLSEMCIRLYDANIILPIQILPSKSTTTLDSFEVPRRITFKESQESDDYVSCLLYLRDGRLLSGGENSIHGLISNFTLWLKDISSFCEYDNHLFVLCADDSEFRVHVVNVINYTIQKSVITCKTDGSCGQIAVNEHYIGISVSGQKSVKIFSSTDYSHLYDIKDDVRVPLAFLDDNVVFSDYSQNVVTCTTLNSKSEVQWKNRDLAKPCLIQVCSQVLLIGAADSRQIYVLSHEGQTLSVFDLPECSDVFRCDNIAVFGKQLAVCDGSESIKVYEVEDDE